MDESNNTGMVVWIFDLDGNLDKDFGQSGGFIQNDTVANDKGEDIYIDRSGQIPVVGSNEDHGGIKGLVIWRLNNEGIMDSSFGEGSYTVYHFGGKTHQDSAALPRAITVDNKNRILVVGQSRRSWNYFDMTIWRFNKNGTIDNDFNGTGFVVFNHIIP